MAKAKGSSKKRNQFHNNNKEKMSPSTKRRLRKILQQEGISKPTEMTTSRKENRTTNGASKSAKAGKKHKKVLFAKDEEEPQNRTSSNKKNKLTTNNADKSAKAGKNHKILFAKDKKEEPHNGNSSNKKKKLNKKQRKLKNKNLENTDKSSNGIAPTKKDKSQNKQPNGAVAVETKAKPKQTNSKLVVKEAKKLPISNGLPENKKPKVRSTSVNGKNKAKSAANPSIPKKKRKLKQKQKGSNKKRKIGGWTVEDQDTSKVCNSFVGKLTNGNESDDSAELKNDVQEYIDKIFGDNYDLSTDDDDDEEDVGTDNDDVATDDIGTDDVDTDNNDDDDEDDDDEEDKSLSSASSTDSESKKLTDVQDEKSVSNELVAYNNTTESDDDDYLFDDSSDESPETDESFDDNDNWSSMEDYDSNDYDDDNDEYDDEDYDSNDYSDDEDDEDDQIYNDFWSNPLETDSDDADYKDEKYDDILIRPGEAKIYKAAQIEADIPFNSDNDDPEIFDITSPEKRPNRYNDEYIDNSNADEVVFSNDDDDNYSTVEDDYSDGGGDDDDDIDDDEVDDYNMDEDDDVDDEDDYYDDEDDVDEDDYNEYEFCDFDETDDSCPELVEITNDIAPTPVTPLILKPNQSQTWKKFPLLNEVELTEETRPVEIDDIIGNMSTKVIDTSFQGEPEERIDDLEDTLKEVENNIEMTDGVNSPPTPETSPTTNDLDSSALVNVIKPKFYNALNSRHVLLVLRDTLYFHGIINLKLLAGSAQIFGYDLRLNETVSAHSPRGHSFVYLSPSDRHSHNLDNIDDKLLTELNANFLHGDVVDAIECFNPETDALILLERDSTNKSVNMIEKYMKQSVYPNVNALNSRRTYYSTEFILHCQFLLQTKKGLAINPEWQQINTAETMRSNSRTIIVGGKGVGKSTLCRYLINSNLTRHKELLLIDLDIGQPELFLPQTVSATIVSEPILGAGFLQNKPPTLSYLFGDVNVLVSPIKYLKCVLKLLEMCAGNARLTSMPWIINTMGYSRGFGLELIVAILKATDPTQLVQIQGHRHLENFECILTAEEINQFKFQIFADEVRTIPQTECTYKAHVFESMSKKLGEKTNEWDITPKDQRLVMILSKLGNILQGNAEWLTDMKPLCASLEDLQIIMTNDDHLNDTFNPNLINANLVYLCRRPNDQDPDIIECYGIGIVRGVDQCENKVYLLPSVEPAVLENVNSLVICSIPLPTSLLLNNSSRIKGPVPYIYNTDDFIGTRQIVQISYRPGKG